MSEIIVSMSGIGQYSLDLSIADPGVEDNSVEVWRAIFTDKEDGEKWEVYFEMSPDYEVWDLIDEAITAYRDSLDPLEE
jgi:uncharacterized protein YrzB (UPF0473 family)